MTLSPFGEQSLTLVAASFDDRVAAEQAASNLKADPALDGEVAVIAPGDPLVSRKMEPEQRGIWHTLVRSHVLLGAVGAVLGLAMALALIFAGWPAAADSPAFAILFLIVMGVFFGMMAGGLITLRPDHGFVIRRIRDALSKGRWAVVVRPLNESCAKTAFAKLQHAGAAPLRSL